MTADTPTDRALAAEQALARSARAREFEDFRLAELMVREAQVHALLALAEAQQPVTLTSIGYQARPDVTLPLPSSRAAES